MRHIDTKLLMFLLSIFSVFTHRQTDILIHIDVCLLAGDKRCPLADVRLLAVTKDVRLLAVTIDVRLLAVTKDVCLLAVTKDVRLLAVTKDVCLLAVTKDVRLKMSACLR